MQFSRPLQHPRLRLFAALSGAALLTVTASGCSATERLTTGMKVRNAVVKLGDESSTSVTASVDGTTRNARKFLTEARGKPVTHRDAVRLARAELTMAAGSEDEEMPLKEMPASEAANVAAALNFGGKDVAAVKSVDDKLYLRVSLRALVRQTDGSAEARKIAKEIVALADDLPSTLGAAKDALKGEWVRADPEAFDDFARAAETLAARGAERAAEKGAKSKEDDKGAGKTAGESDEARRSREIRDAVTIGSALDGQSQREFVAGVQELLREHATFADKGEHDGADRVQLTLPGREAANDLVAAVKPLGAEIDPDRVPDRDVTADLDIRRGQLTTLTLDLGQFTGGPRLPLRLEFSGGDAVAVTAPGGTEELQPQDLVAALMYGALGTENF